MTPRVVYVSVSEMEDFLRCRWRWYAKWRLNRVPRRYSVPLILGTAVHDIFELHLKERSPLRVPLDYALDYTHAGLLGEARTASDPDKAAAYAGAAKELIRYRPQIVAFRDKYPIDETLEVEEAFEWPLHTTWGTSPEPTQYVLRGRPDRPVRIGDVVYHMQHKTVAVSKPVHVYSQYLQRSMHEGMYGVYLSHKYPDRRYGGTIVNLIRKGTATAKHPLETLGFQTIIRVDALDRMRALFRAKAIVKEMHTAEETALKFAHDALIDNPLEDDGFYGNSLDGYLPVLQGKAKLTDDSLFMAREDTYAV